MASCAEQRRNSPGLLEFLSWAFHGGTSLDEAGADYSCTDLNPATVPFVLGKSHTIIYEHQFGVNSEWP